MIKVTLILKLTNIYWFNIRMKLLHTQYHRLAIYLTTKMNIEISFL